MKTRQAGVQRGRAEAPTNPAAILRGAFDSFRLSAGETLFREGDEGDRMYVILEGRLDILVGNTVVETANEGGIVGEMALIDDAPRAASVVATTLCRLVAVDRKRFHSLVQSDPAFATHVMKVLADRLRNMNRLFNVNEKR
jgi:CRP/FNR family transcriptional regulator, cyclic AMP receptor protein